MSKSTQSRKRDRKIARDIDEIINDYESFVKYGPISQRKFFILSNKKVYLSKCSNRMLKVLYNRLKNIIFIKTLEKESISLREKDLLRVIKWNTIKRKLN